MIFVSSVDQEKFGLKTTAFYKQDKEFNVKNSVISNALQGKDREASMGAGRGMQFLFLAHESKARFLIA